MTKRSLLSERPSYFNVSYAGCAEGYIFLPMSHVKTPLTIYSCYKDNKIPTSYSGSIDY